jgi:hypothetical protein
MAEPTKAELASGISARLQELEAAFREYKTVTNLRLDLAEGKAADRERADQDVRAKLAALEANDASFSEKARMLEKLSDRSWGWGRRS